MATQNDFPYAETPATQMLADAIHRRQLEGTSLRKTATQLGYKQAVVLSHMLTGRVPIPIERVPQFAAHLDIEERSFLIAVLSQRYPHITWGKHLDAGAPSTQSNLVASLEMIAGKSPDDLSAEQQRVMREVAADPLAQRRWLSVHDLPMIALLRERLGDLGNDDALRQMEILLGNSCE